MPLRSAWRIAQALAAARPAPTTPNTASRHGYEIAAASAQDGQADQEVVVMIGDGSYLMLNSEIATS